MRHTRLHSVQRVYPSSSCIQQRIEPWTGLIRRCRSDSEKTPTPLQLTSFTAHSNDAIFGPPRVESSEKRAIRIVPGGYAGQLAEQISRFFYLVGLAAVPTSHYRPSKTSAVNPFASQHEQPVGYLFARDEDLGSIPHRPILADALRRCPWSHLARLLESECGPGQWGSEVCRAGGHSGDERCKDETSTYDIFDDSGRIFWLLIYSLITGLS